MDKLIANLHTYIIYCSIAGILTVTLLCWIIFTNGEAWIYPEIGRNIISEEKMKNNKVTYCKNVTLPNAISGKLEETTVITIEAQITELQMTYNCCGWNGADDWITILKRHQKKSAQHAARKIDFNATCVEPEQLPYSCCSNYRADNQNRKCFNNSADRFHKSCK